MDGDSSGWGSSRSSRGEGSDCLCEIGDVLGELCESGFGLVVVLVRLIKTAIDGGDSRVYLLFVGHFGNQEGVGARGEQGR